MDCALIGLSSVPWLVQDVVNLALCCLRPAQSHSKDMTDAKPCCFSSTHFMHGVRTRPAFAWLCELTKLVRAAPKSMPESGWFLASHLANPPSCVWVSVSAHLRQAKCRSRKRISSARSISRLPLPTACARWSNGLRAVAGPVSGRSRTMMRRGRLRAGWAAAAVEPEVG